MDEFLRVDGGCAMLMRGTEGEGYANPRRRPALALYDGSGTVNTIEGEGGGAPPNPQVPDLPDVAGNAQLIRAMLDGSTPVPDPIRVQVDALIRLARGD